MCSTTCWPQQKRALPPFAGKATGKNTLSISAKRSTSAGAAASTGRQSVRIVNTVGGGGAALLAVGNLAYIHTYRHRRAHALQESALGPRRGENGAGRAKGRRIPPPQWLMDVWGAGILPWPWRLTGGLSVPSNYKGHRPRRYFRGEANLERHCPTACPWVRLDRFRNTSCCIGEKGGWARGKPAARQKKVVEECSDLIQCLEYAPVGANRRFLAPPGYATGGDPRRCWALGLMPRRPPPHPLSVLAPAYLAQ